MASLSSLNLAGGASPSLMQVKPATGWFGREFGKLAVIASLDLHQ